MWPTVLKALKSLGKHPFSENRTLNWNYFFLWFFTREHYTLYIPWALLLIQECVNFKMNSLDLTLMILSEAISQGQYESGGKTEVSTVTPMLCSLLYEPPNQTLLRTHTVLPSPVLPLPSMMKWGRIVAEWTWSHPGFRSLLY